MLKPPKRAARKSETRSRKLPKGGTTHAEELRDGRQEPELSWHQGSLGSLARSVILDDGSDFREVQAPRCHVCAHEHAALAS